MIPKCKDEGEFNKLLREAFRAQGLGAIHIREADSPGPSDLLVWCASEILGWVELKIDGKPLEISQVEFMRDQDAKSGNCFVFNLDRKASIVQAIRPEGSGKWVRELTSMHAVDRIPDLDKASWKNWFWRNKRTEQRYR